MKSIPIYLSKESKREAGKLNLKTCKVEFKPESQIIIDVLKKVK